MANDLQLEHNHDIINNSNLIQKLLYFLKGGVIECMYVIHDWVTCISINSNINMNVYSTI